MAEQLQRRISSCQTGRLQPVRHPHVIASFSCHYFFHCRPQAGVLLKLLEIVIQMVQKNAAARALTVEKFLLALRIQCHVVQEKVDQKGRSPAGVVAAKLDRPMALQPLAVEAIIPRGQ